ncbi:MAG: ABC transporter ATP-binding protein [Opitutales bacterium]
MPLIELENVSRFYHLGETTVVALKSIQLSIQSGEFVALCGPSGSGKSTLCNLVAAVDRPSEGSVSINGRALDSLDDTALSAHRNASVGMVFQSFNLVPVLSALENIMLPLQLKGESASHAKERALSMIDELGLEAHAHHLPDKLSGGQRQRVAIARALITQPPLIVADEPTANLDTENAERILEIMLRLNEQDGTTFVFSTHDERLLDRMKRTIRLADGKISADSAGKGGEA